MNVKINFIISILLILTSCSKKDQDNVLLEVILNDYTLEKNDSFYLNIDATNQRVIRFFESRNKDLTTFSYGNKDGTEIKYNDSLFIEYDTIIKNPYLIKEDNYIKFGKGINEIAETFLKDSFNYKSRSNKWNIEEYKFYSNSKNGIRVDVSSPVYNLDKDKAIIFQNNTFGKKKTILFYLIQKIDDQWVIVFKQKNEYFGNSKL